MWVAGALLGLVFVGSTLPTSLYDFYQSELNFSEITLTLVYSAYVAGTLLTLLFLGRISDQIGRRPAALAGLAFAAASMVVFVAEIAIGFLFVGRLLTRLAVGPRRGRLLGGPHPRPALGPAPADEPRRRRTGDLRVLHHRRRGGRALSPHAQPGVDAGRPGVARPEPPPPRPGRDHPLAAAARRRHR